MSTLGSAPAAQAVHMIDAIWCDVHGVFVKGWAHAYSKAPTAVHLRSGPHRATADILFDRPDLQPFFPMLASTLCGFAIYLPCSPFRPVTLEVQTIHGIVELDVTELSPDHPMNAHAGDHGYPIEQFTSEMKQVRGTVLEIGARTVSPTSRLNAKKFEPECKFIGLDIHEAPGVDIVGDAHFLSDVIAPGTIDGVFSLAVIEHLSCPWLLAAQINKVLKPGGLTLHAVPHSFPIHETPNDFWRMSSEGLKVLFSSAMGFEIVQAGMADPVRMFIHPSARVGPMLEFPLHNGMASSWILARKTFDLQHDAVAWPLQRDQSFSQSRAYPAHSQV